MTEQELGELPPDWHEWPRDDKLEYLSITSTREGLLTRICNRCQIDRPITKTSRLKNRELAAVVLTLGEVSS